MADRHCWMCASGTSTFPRDAFGSSLVLDTACILSRQSHPAFGIVGALNNTDCTRLKPSFQAAFHLRKVFGLGGG